MFDTLIKEKADLITFSPNELHNISGMLGNLKTIVQNVPEFRDPYLGGSYKRKTMVKGISDVDVYFRYTGNQNSQSALAILKNRLMECYPNTIVKQDKPSILVDFNKLPFNITPYKQDDLGNMSIPDNTLLSWKLVNLEKLELLILALRKKGEKYIDVIKVLKLWNRNYNKGLKNFEIELKVAAYFLNDTISTNMSHADILWTFFENNGYRADAQKIHAFMLLSNTNSLKSQWATFIDRR